VTANITITATATLGVRNVTVTNPGGASASGTGVFTVTGPQTVTAASPSSLAQGSVSKTVTITGTGFATGATTVFSGTGITVNSTTFVSATSVTANITIAATATLGVRNITVTNPGGAVGTGTGIFTVTVYVPTGPKATKVNGFVTAGKTKTITITGSGFSGRPKITSHGGTTVVVARDTGKLLTVRVTVKAGSRNGTYTFTLKFGNGKSCKVKYVQRA
jgi:hypothetical protein